MQHRASKTSVIETLIDQLLAAETDAQRFDIVRESPVQLADVRDCYHLGDNNYGRNLVFSHRDFEIILMCWLPDQFSAAHDHNGSLCVMKCLSGKLDEQRYLHNKTSLENGLLATELNQMSAGCVSSITDQQGLHSISNNSVQAACSLHFYFPPIKRASVYSLEGAAQKQVSSVFTSEYGVKKR